MGGSKAGVLAPGDVRLGIRLNISVSVGKEVSFSWQKGYTIIQQSKQYSGDKVILCRSSNEQMSHAL